MTSRYGRDEAARKDGNQRLERSQFASTFGIGARLCLRAVLGVLLAACSARHFVESNDEQATDAVAVCESLASATPSDDVCVPWECEWVWVHEVNEAAAMVLNLKEVRLNGTSGVTVDVEGERWRVFGKLALRVDFSSRTELSGRLLDCATPHARTSAFVARPLAPLLPSNSGFELLARADDQSLQFRAGYRGSDLTLLDEDTLVLALGPAGLVVVDVKAVSTGVMQAMTHVPASIDDDLNDVVSVQQRYVFAASKRRGIVVWDLLDRTEPTFVTDGFPGRAPRDGHSLRLLGSTLYLAQAPATGTGVLTAFDVSDPTKPVERFRFVPERGHDVHDVNVRDEFVYVSSLRGGLYVLSVEGEGAETTVVVVGRYRTNNVHNVALLPSDATRQRFVVATERLSGPIYVGQFDPGLGTLALEPTTGAMVAANSREELTHMAASPHNIECAENVCFVAHYQLGLRAFEWSGLVLESSTPLASFSTWQPSAGSERNWLSGASGVLLSSSKMYVLDTHAGLFALRYDRTTAPNQ